MTAIRPFDREHPPFVFGFVQGCAFAELRPEHLRGLTASGVSGAWSSPRDALPTPELLMCSYKGAGAGLGVASLLTPGTNRR